MAIVQKTEAIVQVVKPATYRIQLTELEMRGLKTLLGDGVASPLTSRLHLTDLWQQIYEDYDLKGFPEVTFKSIAEAPFGYYK